jgi:hypothetical protein
MLKKLFISAAAAATVSGPLAGAAWADPPSDRGPSSPGTPSGNGIGQGVSQSRPEVISTVYRRPTPAYRT